MRERSPQERLRVAERETEDLKAHLAGDHRSPRRAPLPVLSTPIPREIMDAHQALREAEREAF